jgi:hypothetical protein
MSESEVKRSIILQGPSNWDKWIEVIKTACIKGDIWEYVNPEAVNSATSSVPERRTALRKLQEPIRPTPGQITAAKKGV